MIFEMVCVGALETNCYIIASASGKNAVIIDPGAQGRMIRGVLDKHKLSCGMVVNTHGHMDHIGCDEEFGVPVYIHHDDLKLLKDPRLNLSGIFSAPFSVNADIRSLSDGQIIGVDGIELEVIHTPGHTPGGISLLLRKPEDKLLFSGDTLFREGIGRTDFTGADSAQLIDSIQKRLFVLDRQTKVYPGHGPSSTIGHEKKSNPFLV